MHWVVRGTGTPKDKDEVNRRDVCECDGECVVLQEFIFFLISLGGTAGFLAFSFYH
jgi:hypothetical protein